MTVVVISDSEKCLECDSRKLERLSEQDAAVSATGSGKSVYKVINSVDRIVHFVPVWETMITRQLQNSKVVKDHYSRYQLSQIDRQSAWQSRHSSIPPPPNFIEPDGGLLEYWDE